MISNNVHQIMKIRSVTKLSVGGLRIHNSNRTMNIYLTRSMGATRVLLHMPAIPPEMKLLRILYFRSGGYWAVVGVVGGVAVGGIGYYVRD